MGVVFSILVTSSFQLNVPYALPNGISVLIDVEFLPTQNIICINL